MKLFTAEGFSFALQVTSLILLVGYAASQSKDESPSYDSPKINKSKASEIHPSYFKIKKVYKLYEFPHLPVKIPKKSVELIKNTTPIC